MKKTIKAIGAILVIVILITLASRDRGSVKNKDIVFGEIAGLTGPYGAVGEAFSRGAQLAQSEWNDANPNRQIRMIVEDDGFDPKKGLSAYTKLTSIDKVDALINATTITIDVAYDSVTKSGLPVAQGFEQSVDATDDNVIQLWPGTAPAEIALGKAVAEKGYTNLVVFVSGESAGYLRFAKAFEQGYGKPVQEFKVVSDSDFRTEAVKALATKPDAIVFITEPKQGALIIKQISALSSEKHQFIFDAMIQTGFSDYQKILGDTNILNGSILYTVPEKYETSFREAYNKKYGVEASIGSETGYNAFMLLAKTYDPDKIKWANAMKKASFIGADGKIVFDRNGVRMPEVQVGVVEGGKLPQ